MSVEYFNTRNLDYVTRDTRSVRLIVSAFLVLLLICGLASCSYVNSAREISTERNGTTLIVKKGGDFQAALNKAKPGDTITLEAGARFLGAFKLPNKSGADFITIRSSAQDSDLPPEGTRIDPIRYSSLLPKIESNVKGEPAIAASSGAHHFRFVAVEFGPTIGGLYDIIQIGTSEETRVEDLPHHIEFDRVYIHGSNAEGQRRGIAANGRNIVVKNSYISDIKRKGEESQAIAAWASDGPIEIVNNYLEAAAENILFGGAGSTLKLVPTDCIVRGNHLNKPVEWQSEPWVVKNLFEVKNGRRIKIENNLMTNNWSMGQDGFGVLFTTRADNGAASIIDDIEFTGNIVRGSGGGVNVYGDEGGGGHKLRITNNIFDDISGPKWKSDGHFMKVTTWNGLVVEKNTILQSGSIILAYGKPVTGFVFRDNIAFHNLYGIFGDSLGTGAKAISTYFPGGTVTNNIIIGGDSSLYREKNIFVPTIKQVGFENINVRDYRLSKQSPYLNKGAGGRQIGADLDTKAIGGT
jgi:hypothetical protein